MAIYGVLNAALYNKRPEGDVEFFATRKERDEALAALREEGKKGGLDSAALRSGIAPVKLLASDMRQVCSTETGERLQGATLDTWLDWYREAKTPEKNAMLKEVGL